MLYEIVVLPAARKALRKLDPTSRERIGAKIDRLARNPRPSGCKKLEGGDELYRIRVGDFRVIYRIEDEVLVVAVVTIGNRRDVYR
jgi:mRNA interferase RelE/StbE